MTYVSKKTEIHIYIIQMIVRQYGDPLTTRLLSAISIGLRFRFLLLERESKFNPNNFVFPLAINVSAEPDVLKSATRELLGQMDLIMRDAAEANLLDPNLLELIWGENAGDRVQKMMLTWEKTRLNLYSAAQQVLSSNELDLSQKKKLFMEALRNMKAETEMLNREYTLRALRAVGDQIEKSPRDVQRDDTERKMLATAV